MGLHPKSKVHNHQNNLEIFLSKSILDVYFSVSKNHCKYFQGSLSGFIFLPPPTPQNLSAAAAAAKSLQSCPTLCDPINGSPPGTAVPGVLQARTLEWVAISFSCMKMKSESEVAQSCPLLRDRMDCSLPGSCIHGIF